MKFKRLRFKDLDGVASIGAGLLFLGAAMLLTGFLAG
jgi:hypothetical protein